MMVAERGMNNQPRISIFGKSTHQGHLMGVPPLKTEGERRSPAFPLINLTTGYSYSYSLQYMRSFKEHNSLQELLCSQIL